MTDEFMRFVKSLSLICKVEIEYNNDFSNNISFIHYLSTIADCSSKYPKSLVLENIKFWYSFWGIIYQIFATKIGLKFGTPKALSEAIVKGKFIKLNENNQKVSITLLEGWKYQEIDKKIVKPALIKQIEEGSNNSSNIIFLNKDLVARINFDNLMNLEILDFLKIKQISSLSLTFRKAEDISKYSKILKKMFKKFWNDNSEFRIFFDK